MQTTKCPEYERGEVKISRTESGHLTSDVSVSAGRLLISDFGVGKSLAKSSLQNNRLLVEWLTRFESDPSYQLRILGSSDCVGSARTNNSLRNARAEAVYRLLGPKARSRVVFKGAAPDGQYSFPNESVETRARNRGATVDFSQDISFIPEIAVVKACQNPSPASTVAEFTSLVLCVEAAVPRFSARQVLSLLRQIFYGDEPWSVTRREEWPSVIRCGIKFRDPAQLLGSQLFFALRSSQELHEGSVYTDIGHVLTGLEAMVCPTSAVDFKTWPAVLSKKVNMANEEFATWGGDLGKAAALKVHDKDDRGKPRPWSAYFGGANTEASEQDLNGDIDAYAIRAALLGRPCSETRLAPIGPIAIKVSDLFNEYYGELATPIGRARAGRFNCFVEAMGGVVEGRRIVNRNQVRQQLTRRVRSAAGAFHQGLQPFPWPGRGVMLSIATREIVDLLLAWLQRGLP